MTRDSSRAVDVAVVGLGPSGAALALLLARQGLRVAVLEREATVHALPRAIHMDAETMRVFQAAGIALAIAPYVAYSSGVRYLDGSGKLLHERLRPDVEGPQGWHLGYRFNQPGLEQALRERLALQSNVQVMLEAQVIGVASDAHGVTLAIDGRAGSRALRAAWVVGCDGARSTVRRHMRTHLEDLRSHESWLVVDLVLTADVPALGDFGIQHCDPARPTTFIPGVGRRRRWELMLMPGDDAEAIARPENLWPLLARWVTPASARLERSAVYTFHSVVARGWRDGRLLLAGDAVHQTPPFLGQGMCAGIRDASNLAWKLAIVQRGADAALLDSYESERAPHVRTLIETAIAHGAVIQTTNPEVAAQRDRDLRAGGTGLGVPQPLLGPGLHDDSPFAGRLAPQPRLADGSRLDDRIGYRFALLLRRGLRASLPHAVELVVIDDMGVQPWLEEVGVVAALLRPDRYLAGTARNELEIGPLIARHYKHFAPGRQRSPAQLLFTTQQGPPSMDTLGLRFSHIGLYAHDMAKMERFYTRVLEFTVTDRGSLQTPRGVADLIFFSRDPDEHHQIVLVSGRPADIGFNPINQISMRAETLADLRLLHGRVKAEGTGEIRSITHGNAVSMYVPDPEGNRLELYMDLPWYVSQPHGEAVDLTLPDDTLMEQLEAHASRQPGFRPRAQWRQEMVELMGHGSPVAHLRKGLQ